MRAADQFHVGIVVEDLDDSLVQLGELLGYSWSDEVRVAQEVLTPSGSLVVEFRFRYSRDEPRIEVIQAQPGTVWVPAPGSGLHHLGYWSDDVGRDGARLTAAGYAMEAQGAALDDGGPAWAYHRHPAGPRIELLSRALEPGLSLLWA